MKKIIRIIFLLTLVSFRLHAETTNSENINKAHKYYHDLNQIKIEAGGILMLDQVLKKSNIKGDTFLQFHCQNINNKTSCTLIRLDTTK